jgi:hypothetical protein
VAGNARAEPGLARPGDAVARTRLTSKLVPPVSATIAISDLRLARAQMTAGDRRHARPGIDGMDRRRRDVGGRPSRRPGW